MKTLLLLSLLFVAGCAGVQYLGQVGDTKFYSVHNSKLDGPNFDALVTSRNGEVAVNTTFGGPGLLTSMAPAMVNAAGNVGAAEVFGTNLRPDRTTVNASGSASGGNASATGGASNAVAKNNSDNSTTTNNDISKVNSDDTVQENNVNVGK